MKKNGNRLTADSTVQEQFDVLMEDVRGLARQIGHAASNQIQSVGTRAQEAGESVNEWVRERPMRAVLVAAGVGYVLSFLMRRR
jgi:ElaB/YqjD/DUF883 family membrane-anchored ribosome-binding protein